MVHFRWPVRETKLTMIRSCQIGAKTQAKMREYDQSAVLKRLGPPERIEDDLATRLQNPRRMKAKISEDRE